MSQPHTPRVPEPAILEAMRQSLSYDPSTGELRWARRKRAITLGQIAGHRQPDGYIAVSVDGVRRKAHHIAWFLHYGVWPSTQVDHWDHDPSNNRISNLRLATGSQNMHNRRGAHRGNSTGVLGVTFYKATSQYRVFLKANGKNMYLGAYSTIEAAREVRLAAERKYHGDFASSAAS